MQKRAIHPKVNSLVEALKAVERYNDHARPLVRKLRQRKQEMDASGEAAQRQPNAVKKLLYRGFTKRGSTIRPKVKPGDQRPTVRLANNGSGTAAPAKPTLKPCESGEAPQRIFRLKCNASRQETPKKTVRFSKTPKRHPRVRSRLRPPPLPPRVLKLRSQRNATMRPATQSNMVLTATTKGPLAGLSVVDRSRDPRLKGRLNR